MKAKAIIFWLLMLGSAAGLWLTASHFPWWESLLIVVVVVPSVLLTNRFRARFSGRKRRMADAAIYSVGGIMLTSAFAAWRFELVSIGYESRGSLVLPLSLLTASCFALLWSVLRLRKLPS